MYTVGPRWFYAHLGLIFATYITFKFFHKARKEQRSVFVEGNYNPAKIFSVLFIVFFIFIFTKGLDVLTKTNSYEIPYSGPDTTTEERIKKVCKIDNSYLKLIHEIIKSW